MLTSTLKKSFPFIILLVVVWAPLQAYLLHQQFQLTWYRAGFDSLIHSIMLGLAGFVTANTLAVYKPEKKRIIGFVIWTLAFSYAVSMIAELIIESTGDSPFEYLKTYNPQRLTYSLLIGLILFLIAWIRTTKSITSEEDTRRADMEKIARDAELASLRQQLQPHFLFNSLNSINALIGSQPEKARQMVQQLSDFLRGTVKKDDSQLVPLFEELHQLKLYLEIEKVRFGHRLATEIDNDNASLNCKLPPLLIQPVVENAIKFGLYDTIGETVIKVKTTFTQHELLIEVENPFDEVTSSPRHGTGFGLSSMQRRLYLLYARNDLLTTENSNGIFKTQIRIPQHI